MSLRNFLVVVLLLVIALGAIGQSAERPIVFVSEMEGLTGNTRRDLDVWLLWPGTGRYERLSENTYGDGGPTLSADERYVAFTSDSPDVEDGQTLIVVVDRERHTSRTVVVEDDLGGNLQFIGGSNDLLTTSRGGIFRVNFEGVVTQIRTITEEYGSPWITGLSLSNSGDWGVMVRVVDPPPEEHDKARVDGVVQVDQLIRIEELVLLDAQFNEVQVLLRGARSNWNRGVFHGQDISDDGNTIVYGYWADDRDTWDTHVLNRMTGSSAMVAMNAAGAQLSPDGQLVAFGSGRRDAAYGLFIVNIDGTGERRLTLADKHSQSARW